MNDGLAFIADNNPQSELETMLLTQAWMTHTAAIAQQRRFGGSHTLDQLQVNGTLTVKMAKLFIQQIEAFAKLRNAGKQLIEVQHVHVYSGGQAVVGAVHAGGRGAIENGNQPHDPVVLTSLAHEPIPAVWSDEPRGEALREPGH